MRIIFLNFLQILQLPQLGAAFAQVLVARLMKMVLETLTMDFLGVIDLGRRAWLLPGRRDPDEKNIATCEYL